MSIDSDLEDFIQRTETLLQGLEGLAQELAEEVGELQAASTGKARSENLLHRMEQACSSAGDLLKQMESSSHENQARLNLLEEELKTLIECLEADVVKHFTKGEYQECLGMLSFLCLLKPNDRKLREYLETTRSRVGEGNAPSAVRRYDAVSPPAAELSLQRPTAIGLWARFKRAWPSRGNSFQVSQPPIGDEDIPQTSEALVLSLLQVKLAEFKSRLQTHLNGQRFRQRDWVWGTVVLLTCTALLIGVSVGKHFLSGTRANPTKSYALRESKLADTGGERASALPQSHLPEDSKSTLQEDISTSARQNPLGIPSSDQVNLEESAQALFDVGRLEDATRICDAILQEDPANGMALDLKQRIREYSARQAKTHQSKRPSNRPGEDVPHPDREQPPTAQLSLLPPGNLARPVVGVPGNSGLGDVRYSPSVQKSAPDPLTIVTPWLQKAHSAMRSGHYVLPPVDSVVYYCRRALAIDPGNEEALILKSESFVQALSQAKEWTQNGNYDEARNLYSSLYYLSKYESKVSWSNQELEQELQKLEFKAYPVIHEHTLGSCTGRLRMNGYVVSFVPTLDTGEGFTEKLSRVNATALNDKLKLKVGEKIYRFRPNRGNDKAANQENLKDMYGQLVLLLTGSN
ncbi:MAG TPA: hypothetical protein VMW38_26915 [Terriglobia bacterium]|nr:hypothetical protein [Terriglobia bacterium]